jgi:hypothetical protein
LSARSFRHVLALLHDCEQDIAVVLDRAVEMAQAERARLTLAKTTDPGRLVRWFGALAPLGRMAPLCEPDLEAIAGHRLARAAELIPAEIPVSTVLFGRNTARALRKLAAGGAYDLLVVAATELGRDAKLRREIARLDLCTLAVTRDGAWAPERALDGIRSPA